jgi:hypothetical protein
MNYSHTARSLGILLVIVMVLTTVIPALALNPDTRVSVGSPTSPFSQNKQNEPAIAIDANHPNILAAGANDNIDMEACNAGPDNDCPFTPGVGVSGIYFSFDNGTTWAQPTYTGLTARDCLGAVGNDDPPCEAHPGPIGTLPWYAENGLVSDGDPAVAFGPQPGPDGFSWENGSRLYYANLTSNLSANRDEAAFKGFEALAVSRTDDVQAAADGNKNAWMPPVIVSKQNAALFEDKEQIWADNAESSPFFGNVYVCSAAYRSNSHGNALPLPILVAISQDGGDTWQTKQVTQAATNAQQGNRSGCTIRTDSEGVVYVFFAHFAVGFPGFGATALVKSFDGGLTWTHPVDILPAVDACNAFEPSIGRCVEDGVAGARNDLASAPSVDIANGAPTGADATDQIVLTWVDGRDGLNNEHVMFTTSTNGGSSWAAVREVEQGSDRGYYSAPAISPNGTDVWLVYNAFLEPFKDSAVGPDNDRPLVGVVLHADVSGSSVGAFSEIHRSPSGDARGSSQNNLAAEFLGDYVYAAATRTYGAAVWNDVRNAADCPAIDAYRQALHEEALATGQQTAEAEEPRGEMNRDMPNQGEDEPAVAPDVQQVCPATFGNSDIFGGSYADPTP